MPWWEGSLGGAGTSLTFNAGCQQAEEVAAGLLQEDVVVTFIRAVWVVVIPQVTQAVHCNEATCTSSLKVLRRGRNLTVLAGPTKTALPGCPGPHHASSWAVSAQPPNQMLIFKET